jgi:hypothetical protein
MARAVKRRVSVWAPYAVVLVMAMLAFGTVSNQLRINRASMTLKAQAVAGAQSLHRQCQLLPAGFKVQRYLLDRHVTSSEDFALWLSTARRYCPDSPLFAHP